MDAHMQSVVDKRIGRTVEALRKNGFDAHGLASREALMQKLPEYLPAGASCSVGGSMTLTELGLLEYLRDGRFHYLDRYAEGIDPHRVFHDALSCDVYLTSSNAITEDGKLYNMDGNGNRVAALVYGPEKVVVIAGYNKIVADLDAARERRRLVAAPANAARLGKEEIPCYHTGKCSDCGSPGRFCNAELVTHRPRVPGRIAVLILPEELGY